MVGNLYRPAKIDKPLPAVLYLCGHTKGKVNAPYQANPRWFGQHGYVALVLDPIQLGESQGFHHGTYRGGRWDWPSRGYTPAGTEVWNAMRALDYLETRADVDSERMGVTGLSGGGVISWCLGAADERVKVIVPVCQSGSIHQVVNDRGTDGHCDCEFWINYYRWCWPDIGSLIAPRALLIASGADDVLWRPYGYRAAAEKIRRQYYQLKSNENFDLVEDATPHGYTPKLRQAIFTWFNKHLKNDPTPVTDDVTEFVEPEENLLVFSGKLPENDQMAKVDQLLVSRGKVPELRDKQEWLQFQQAALDKLRATTFRNTLGNAAPKLTAERSDGSNLPDAFETLEFVNADGLQLAIRFTHPVETAAQLPTLVFPLPADETRSFMGGGGARPLLSPGLASAAVEVRNTGATSVGPGYLWTARRTYPLLGETLPERQVADFLDAITVLNNSSASPESIAVFGQGAGTTTAIYAALLNPQISEIVLADCPTTHEDANTPEFLGVLRVGDLPQNLALAFPRKITFVGRLPAEYEWTRQIYTKFGEAKNFKVIKAIAEWSADSR